MDLLTTMQFKGLLLTFRSDTFVNTIRIIKLYYIMLHVELMLLVANFVVDAIIRYQLYYH